MLVELHELQLMMKECKLVRSSREMLETLKFQTLMTSSLSSYYIHY